jgi:histidinol-phosphate aminotransferase
MRGVLRIINRYDPGVIPENISEAAPKLILLGSNENPYPPSKRVAEAYVQSLNLVRIYPDADYRLLKRKIAEYSGFEVRNIAVGCGASEIISCLCNAILEPLDRVVIPMPSYTLYAIYAMLRDSEILFPVFDSYSVEADVIAEYKPKLTFLCSPNNPTGNTVERKVVEKVAENSEYVVLDEAYVEFAETSCSDLVREFDNIVILRSFSKFFGLAGMRVGYAITSPQIADAIEKIRLPFGISHPSVVTAIAALESMDYYLELRDKIVVERERLFRELSRISYLKPYPSKANFILVRVEGIENLENILLKEKIIVRSVTGLMGLEGEHVRITVGRREENDRLIEVLRKLQ